MHSSEETIDHMFDWRKTIQLRAKPEARKGEGVRCWAPFIHGLQVEAKLHVDTDMEPKYPESQLPPRIQDRRLYLCMRETGDRCNQTGLNRETSRRHPKSSDASQGSEGNWANSSELLTSLPFFASKTVTLRRKSQTECSHSPRFQTEHAVRNKSSDEPLKLRSLRVRKS